MMMKTDRSDWKLPRDWIVLLTIPAIAIISASIFPVVQHALQISPSLVLIALVLAVAGIILVLSARRLLHRQRKHLASEPNKLPQNHRNLYRIGCVCIILSLVIIVTLQAIPRNKANNQSKPTVAAAANMPTSVLVSGDRTGDSASNQCVVEKTEIRYGTWDKGENTPTENAVMIIYLRQPNGTTGEPTAAALPSLAP